MTWDQGAPVEGDTVVITNAVTLTNSTPFLESVSNSATLTFAGWNTILSSRVVTVGATITHAPQSATTTNASGVWVPDNRIWIECSNLTVLASKAIDANGKGYQGPPATYQYGRGPGRPTTAPYRGIGGSYGGIGSCGDGLGIGPT